VEKKQKTKANHGEWLTVKSAIAGHVAFANDTIFVDDQQ